MDTFQIEGEEDIILVEFAPVAGVRSVSLSPRDAIEKSREAIEDALDKMRGMAKRQQKLSRKKFPGAMRISEELCGGFPQNTRTRFINPVRDQYPSLKNLLMIHAFSSQLLATSPCFVLFTNSNLRRCMQEKPNEHLDQPRIALVKWPLAVPSHRCLYASFR